MSMSNIDVILKGDFEMSEEEQDYHEDKISLFKHFLEKELSYIKFKTNGIILINVEYYPENQTFKVIEISTLKEKILTHLKETELINQFNIKL